MMSEQAVALESLEKSTPTNILRRIGDLVVKASHHFPISANIIGADLIMPEICMDAEIIVSEHIVEIGKEISTDAQNYLQTK